MLYKVIFIDWDGTLSKSRFWDRWQGTPRYQQIQEVLFRDGRDLLYNWMRGWIPYSTVLRYVESKTNMTYKELEDELRFGSENMSLIDPKVIEQIQELRGEGVKVVIATDNMDVFRLWTIPALQLEELFDGILVSDTRGALKTDFHKDGTSMFFMHYLSQSDAKPDEMVLIDDSLDTKVVENIGMHFLHVNENIPLSAHLASILKQNK